MGSKISQLTENTTPLGTDQIEMLDDPGGTPLNQKVTFANATKALSAMTGDSGSGGVKGLVPAPAAGDAAANKFLKANGLWATTPTGGDASTNTSSSVDSEIVLFSGT